LCPGWHLRIAGKVPKDFGLRTDTPEYPLDALREATVNAIIHRDYFDPSGFIEIAINDDRIEIWNNGMLPTGISFPDLLKPHRSVLRNPLIAEAFFLNSAIESRGRGTLTRLPAFISFESNPQRLRSLGSQGIA
jgi:ATP-dependent DNA helicase RecG